MKQAILICFVLLAGCRQVAQPLPKPDDGTIKDGHEVTLEELHKEVEDLKSELKVAKADIQKLFDSQKDNPPTPGPSLDGWSKITHDTFVQESRVRAAILRELAGKSINSAEEASDWLKKEMPNRIDPIYANTKAKLQDEFQTGWTEERYDQIILEQAKGYDLVK